MIVMTDIHSSNWPMQYTYKCLLIIVLGANYTCSISAQESYRLSFSIDNGVGCGNINLKGGYNFHSSLLFINKNGFKPPSFTITKRINENYNFKIQTLITRAFLFPSTSVYFLLNKTILSKQKSITFFESGIYFDVSGDLLIRHPKNYVQYNYRPGLTIGLSHIYQITKRFFIRPQFLLSSRIFIYEKSIVPRFAAFCNFSVGTYLGKIRKPTN